MLAGTGTKTNTEHSYGSCSVLGSLTQNFHRNTYIFDHAGVTKMEINWSIVSKGP